MKSGSASSPRPRAVRARALAIESLASTIAAVLTSIVSKPGALVTAAVTPLIIEGIREAAGLPKGSLLDQLRRRRPPVPPAENAAAAPTPEPQQRRSRSVLWAILGAAFLAFVIGISVASAFSRVTDVGKPIVLSEKPAPDANGNGPAPGDDDKPQCSDDVDNDGDQLVDEADPGCHTGGDPNAPYEPTDDDEADAPKRQCSDEVDNDGDQLVDEADPGCHTGGDPNAPYDRTDDDEADA
jgi:hypothetical protein